jgi:hypothetical protein
VLLLLLLPAAAAAAAAARHSILPLWRVVAVRTLRRNIY